MEYIKSGPYYTWSIQLSESSVSLYTKNAFKFTCVLSADSNGVIIVELKKKSECTCHDVMMPWCHDFMMSWCHNAMMPWCHDVMMTWLPGLRPIEFQIEVVTISWNEQPIDFLYEDGFIKYSRLLYSW